MVSDVDLVANFVEGVEIGDGGDATNEYLPSISLYKNTLSEQIYTVEELGSAGVITSIAFYNGGTAKTRFYDFYLKATSKSTFTGNRDWETISASDKVFSGEVTMVANDWTTITLNPAFLYDGTSNLVLVADDHTTSTSGGMKCRVFDAPSQAIRVFSESTNYDPTNTSNYYGTILNVKNQIRITKSAPSTDPINITVSANPAQGGTVTGGGMYNFGEMCTVTAMANTGYYFVGWRENDEIISNDSEISFVVLNDREFVAMFVQAIEIGENTTTNYFLPSYSYYNYTLSQQIYTAEEIGTEGTINSIAFYNEGGERSRTYDLYLATTEKSSFSENTVVIDDNSGRYDGTPYMACSVYNTSTDQAIYSYSSYTNYNPLSPPTTSGSTSWNPNANAVLSVKNHILLGISTQQAATKAINAFTADGGYYLIAVPFEEINPEEVEDMLANVYDLYQYGETEKEWLNYKVEAFNLEAGKGYLYANSDTLMLNFTGVPYNGDGSVVLHKTGDGETAGWNLVGNPFNEIAYIDREFYVMSADGSRIELAQRDYILPMEGIFVVANEEGEVLMFSTTASAKGKK